MYTLTLASFYRWPQARKKIVLLAALTFAALC